MGKIVRFDTSQAIGEAAARAEQRATNPVARLDQRVADLAADYEARQNRERRKVAPGPRLKHPYRARRSGWNPSGIEIFKIGMTAFALFWALSEYDKSHVPSIASANPSADTEVASFGFCHSGGGTNCVVDGDTIWYRGNNIRIADIDTPETHPPQCQREAKLGAAATQRLQSLLSAGPFSVQPIDRDTDRYGRQLRVLTRDGESIGGMLVDEGLARYYEGGRRSWC